MTLDDWLTVNGMTSDQLAKKIRISKTTAWRVRYGKVKPSLDTIAKIEELTKNEVTAKDFFKSGEQSRGVA